MTTKDYKPQIDGLRALAVLPVILFHAGFESFEGGFVGVDIFFVISGYLITKLILDDVYNNKFNLGNFYLRRARRLLPALFFVILITIPFSIFLMSNDQLIYYSKQIFSVIFFISNLFFWKNSGYFDPESDLQPLLHTWSLAVEEQFYIFFPILLILVFKFLKKKIIVSLVIIALISLSLSQIGGNFKTNNLSGSFPFFILPFDFFWQAGSANFYLPFGRAWELILGAIIALILSKKKVIEKKNNNFFSTIGFFLILISIFFYSKDIQYPSIFTLLPCLGTSLIIIYTDKKTFLFKILTYKPIVFLGLVSYSLYLWHQPVLSFSKIFYGTELSIFATFFLLSISFVLSLLSWRFIEQPFRNKKIINDKNFLKILITFILTLSTLALMMYLGKISSVKKKLPEKITQTFSISNNNHCFGLDGSHLKNSKKWYCEVGNKKSEISFIVIGDSHASALIPGFNLAAKEKKTKGIITGFAGCPVLLSIQSIRDNNKTKDCLKLSEKVFNFAKSNKIKKIFHVGRWNYYTGDEYNRNEFQPITSNNSLFSNKKNSKKDFIKGLKHNIKSYNDINIDPIFVYQAPLQLYEPQFIYLNAYDFQNNKVNLEKVEKFSVSFKKNIDSQKFIRKNINLLKKENYRIKEIDLNDLFCNKSKCLVGNEKTSFYGDNDHLSIEGAKLTKNKILEKLN